MSTAQGVVGKPHQRQFDFHEHSGRSTAEQAFQPFHLAAYLIVRADAHVRRDHRVGDSAAAQIADDLFLQHARRGVGPVMVVVLLHFVGRAAFAEKQRPFAEQPVRL